MNQSGKRGKSRGGPNRGRRNTGSPNHQTFNQPMNEDHDFPSSYDNPCFVHAVTSLIGCHVQLTAVNGSVYDGILRTVSPKVEVVLDVAHLVTKKIQHGSPEEYIQVPSKSATMDTFVIAARNIISIDALNIDRDQVMKKDTFTDQAISNKVNGQVVHERELKKWEDPGGGSDVHFVLGDNQLHNGLDADEMLAINEQKYGVKSTYDSEMLSYTTALEKSSNQEFKEKERKAERLAREIEQDSSFYERAEIDSGKTEEELYSAVLRTGTPSSGQQRYVPPARRNKQTPVMIRKDEAKTEETVASLSVSKQDELMKPPKSGMVDDAVSSTNEQLKPEIKSEEKEGEMTLDTNPPQATPLNSMPASKNTSVSSLPGKPASQTTGSPPQAAPNPRVIPMVSTIAASGPGLVKPIPEHKQTDKGNREVLNDLLTFKDNFKLETKPRIPREEKKEQGSLSPELTESQKVEQSQDLVTQSAKQADSPKPAEQKSAAIAQEASPAIKSKLNPNAKEFVLNPNAKEFKPSPQVQRTPPLVSTPQPMYAPHIPAVGSSGVVLMPYSPTTSRSMGFAGYPMVQPSQAQMYKAPRSPGFTPGKSRFYEPSSGDPSHPPPHGHVAIPAALAAGNPIIQPGSIPGMQYIPQGMPFMPQMVQAGSGPYMTVSQSGQHRYIQPQSAGMTTSIAHSMHQGYQEQMTIYATPPHQSPAQASPSQQGQFFQYQAMPPQMMANPQHPGVPHQPQGHMGAQSPSQVAPPQQFVYLPQGMPQPGGMPASQMGQFVPVYIAPPQAYPRDEVDSDTQTSPTPTSEAAREEIVPQEKDK
ncbi:ataxin-2-like protein isoform X1 [Nematostella vectensis]|uniref:ataxin-2-like protein isoform X1 n=1 Tax=Nematostella vectensis TaxID=45351 RepID=UPI0020774394|nr:ataxin-2-like protein isoform X1 [Nematostella vectensis]